MSSEELSVRAFAPASATGTAAAAVSFGTIRFKLPDDVAALTAPPLSELQPTATVASTVASSFGALPPAAADDAAKSSSVGLGGSSAFGFGDVSHVNGLAKKKKKPTAAAGVAPVSGFGSLFPSFAPSPSPATSSSNVTDVATTGTAAPGFGSSTGFAGFGSFGGNATTGGGFSGFGGINHRGSGTGFAGFGGASNTSSGSATSNSSAMTSIPKSSGFAGFGGSSSFGSFAGFGSTVAPTADAPVDDAEPEPEAAPAGSASPPSDTAAATATPASSAALYSFFADAAKNSKVLESATKKKTAKKSAAVTTTDPHSAHSNEHHVRLYRHALESVFSFLPVASLARVLATSKEWAATVRSMGPLSHGVLLPARWVAAVRSDVAHSHYSAERFAPGNATRMIIPKTKDALPTRMRIEPVLQSAGLARHITQPHPDRVRLTLTIDVLQRLTAGLPNLRVLDAEIAGAKVLAAFHPGMRLPSKLVSLSLSGTLNDALLIAIGELQHLRCLELKHTGALRADVSLAPLQDLSELREFTLTFFRWNSPPLRMLEQLRLLPHLDRMHSSPIDLTRLQLYLAQPHKLQWKDIGAIPLPLHTVAPLLVGLPSLTNLVVELHTDDLTVLHQLPNLRRFEARLTFAQPSLAHVLAALVREAEQGRFVELDHFRLVGGSISPNAGFGGGSTTSTAKAAALVSMQPFLQLHVFHAAMEALHPKQRNAPASQNTGDEDDKHSIEMMDEEQNPFAAVFAGNAAGRSSASALALDTSPGALSKVLSAVEQNNDHGH
jgi:hypothetical protein